MSEYAEPHNRASRVTSTRCGRHKQFASSSASIHRKRDFTPHLSAPTGGGGGDEVGRGREVDGGGTPVKSRSLHNTTPNHIAAFAAHRSAVIWSSSNHRPQRLLQLSLSLQATPRFPPMSGHCLGGHHHAGALPPVPESGTQPGKSASISHWTQWLRIGIGAGVPPDAN